MNASVINLAGTGLSTLSASTSPGAGLTCVASAISGNAATITFGGAPAPGDTCTITLNGQAITTGFSVYWNRQSIHIAAIAFGLLQMLIAGDILSYLQSNKGVVQTTTTRANCQTPGLMLKTWTDQRPTTTTAGVLVINDSESTVP